MDHHDTSSSNTPAQGNRTPPKAVYTVTERADGSRSFWTRVGSAWVNRDGSLTLRLDALPVNGVLQVREAEERRDSAPNGGAR